MSESSSIRDEPWKGRGKGRRSIFLAECRGLGVARPETVPSSNPTQVSYEHSHARLPSPGADASSDHVDSRTRDQDAACTAPLAPVAASHSSRTGTRTWVEYIVVIDGRDTAYYHDPLAGITMWRLPEDDPVTRHLVTPGHTRRWEFHRTNFSGGTQTVYHDPLTGEVTSGCSFFLGTTRCRDCVPRLRTVNFI